MLESRLLRPSMRAVIYSRVSTDAQEKEGTSLDTQEEACIKFAQENSWDITERVRETASGHTLERPGFGPIYLKQSPQDIANSILYSETVFKTPADGEIVNKNSFDRAWRRLSGHK